MNLEERQYELNELIEKYKHEDLGKLFDYSRLYYQYELLKLFDDFKYAMQKEIDFIKNDINEINKKIK